MAQLEQLLNEQFSSTSLWMIILLLGVIPAIAEELMFSRLPASRVVTRPSQRDGDRSGRGHLRGVPLYRGSHADHHAAGHRAGLCLLAITIHPAGHAVSRHAQQPDHGGILNRAFAEGPGPRRRRVAITLHLRSGHGCRRVGVLPGATGCSEYSLAGHPGSRSRGDPLKPGPSYQQTADPATNAQCSLRVAVSRCGGKKSLHGRGARAEFLSRRCGSGRRERVAEDSGCVGRQKARSHRSDLPVLCAGRYTVTRFLRLKWP